MNREHLPIPSSVALTEYPAILLGMAGFALIVTIAVSLMFVGWHFLIGDRKLDGLLTVATITFLVCFLAYLVWDFTSKRESLLRRSILLRKAGVKFLQEGNYDKAVIYLQEGITSLQTYRDTMSRPMYDDHLEEATSALKLALERQQDKR